MARRRSPGALEAAVLRVLWQAGRPLSAREVQGSFDPADGVPAFTTVLTVLERLRAKQRVDRAVSADGTLVFSSVQSEAGHAVEAMMAALRATSDRSAALLQFAGTLDPRDVALLRRALPPGDRPGRVD